MVDLSKQIDLTTVRVRFTNIKTLGDLGMVARLCGKDSKDFKVAVANFKLNSTNRSEHRFTVAH